MESLYTTIVETTPPTSSTTGVVGQWYIDTTANKLYQYRSSGWEEIGAGGGSGATMYQHNLSFKYAGLLGALLVNQYFKFSCITDSSSLMTFNNFANYAYTTYGYNKNLITGGLTLIGQDSHSAIGTITRIYPISTTTLRAEVYNHTMQGEITSIDITSGFIADFTDAVVEITASSGREPTAVTITAPSTATTGTLLGADLATLQASNENYIIFNNEIYKLQDKQTDSGYLVYSHTGEDSTHNFYIKCITVTISTLGWVLTSKEVGGGGTQRYRHSITLVFALYHITFDIINNTSTKFTGAAEIAQWLATNGYTDSTKVLHATWQSSDRYNIYLCNNIYQREQGFGYSDRQYITIDPSTKQITDVTITTSWFNSAAVNRVDEHVTEI